MKSERTEKIAEYATSFFILVFSAMSFSRWVEQSEFFPKWLIALFFALSTVTFFWYWKLNTQRSRHLTQEYKSPEPKERKPRQTDWNEIRRAEDEAHRLIVRICESKNIRLRLKQEGRSSGHCEIPEIWTIEKAVPLTPDEFYAITVGGVLHIDKKVGDDGIIYAAKFTRGGGWVVYEQETKTD